MPLTHKLKIMILTPVGDPTDNEVFADMARNYKDTNTHVTVATLSRSAGSQGPLLYPVTRTLVFAELVRACYQARIDGYDALVMNCICDFVLDELRQIAGDMVVVGPAQSSIQTALRLGKRYSMIIPYESGQEPIEDALISYSVEHKPISYRSTEMMFGRDVLKMGEDTSQLAARLHEKGKLAIECDGAEVLILACTMGVGHYQALQKKLGVPVIDAGIAALKTAELSAQMRRTCGWETSNINSGKAPTDKELEQFCLLQEPYVYSGKVEVD